MTYQHEPAFLFVGNLGKSVLLLVWIPVSCVCHFDHIVLPDLNSHGVFPAVW